MKKTLVALLFLVAARATAQSTAASAAQSTEAAHHPGSVASSPAQPPTAAISESEQSFPTYDFSDPSPIPLLTPVYPYFRYDGFTSTATPKKWKVITLENKYIKLLIFPQVGGKVWAAIEKSTNRPFLYFNHTVKFRDIAMRGPWTSGGLEANFGIMGHTPATATPVDYLTRINEDGSASCFIGCLDLLTRSYWRVEIRLPSDQALFTTTARWYNTTAQEQPYYHWMNAGLKAGDDLEFIFPGNKYLGHSGEYAAWPANPNAPDQPGVSAAPDQPRVSAAPDQPGVSAAPDQPGVSAAPDQPVAAASQPESISRPGVSAAVAKPINWYKNNDFGGYKSYHVFGRYTDFSGAYWHNDDMGTVRYGTHDDKAGKKIWIWGLSRQGMIWEKLLTDTDGQYVESQSGRLFNQNGDKSTLTPFKHRALAPYESDTWQEYWYPLLGTKGFVAASEYGALNLRIVDGRLHIDFSPTREFEDSLHITAAGKTIYNKYIHFKPLKTFSDSVALTPAGDSSSHRTTTAGDLALSAILGPRHLVYDAAADTLSRPVNAPADFDWTTAYGHYLKGCEALDQKFYPEAELDFDSALAKDHNYLPALAKQAGLYYRNIRYSEALTLAKRALSINTEDGEANFIYGLINEQLGRDVNTRGALMTDVEHAHDSNAGHHYTTDAKDGFDIASLDPAWRSAAEASLARIWLREHNLDHAMASVDKALTAQPQNMEALQLRALIARLQGNTALHTTAIHTILTLDPLNFFARFETAPDSLSAYIKSELPQETYLELGIWYANLGQTNDALAVLRQSPPVPEVRCWIAYLTHQPFDTTHIDPTRSFPFRSETAAVLEALLAKQPGWFLRYQLALIDKDRNRTQEARQLLNASGDEPSFAPFYATRAALSNDSASILHDLQKALTLDPQWRCQKLLAEFYLNHAEYTKAETIAGSFYRSHPQSYIMGMLYAKALLLNHRYAEGDQLLSHLTIIPFEGATAGRELYREAKLMQAVALIKQNQFKRALTFINQARQWPENLGVGEPYPENEDLRLEDWMSYRCYTALHQTTAASAALQSILRFQSRIDNGNPNFIPANDILMDWARAAAAQLNASATRSDASVTQPAHHESENSRQPTTDANSRIINALER